MAAMNGARRQLRTRHHVGLAADQPGERAATIRRAAAPARALRPAGARLAAPALRAHRRGLIALEQSPQPVAELATIIFAHGVVADGRGDLDEARLERRAP